MLILFIGVPLSYVTFGIVGLIIAVIMGAYGNNIYYSSYKKKHPGTLGKIISGTIAPESINQDIEKEETEKEELYCSDCNAIVKEEDNFCPNCGAELED